MTEQPELDATAGQSEESTTDAQVEPAPDVAEEYAESVPIDPTPDQVEHYLELAGSDEAIADEND